MAEKEIKEFGGEKQNLEIQRAIAEKMAKKFADGKYDEIKRDIGVLLHSSNRIKQLYERWELEVVKRLIQELGVHEELNRLSHERAKDLGRARMFAKDMMKKSPLMYGKEKEMDKIADDIKKYTRTFGEAAGGKLRDSEDLKRKVQFIIEEDIKKSKKKLSSKNLDYLKEQVIEFMRTDGEGIFRESEVFRGNPAGAKKLAQEIIILAGRKIEDIKAKLGK
jgi:hypothetical protein